MTLSKLSVHRRLEIMGMIGMVKGTGRLRSAVRDQTVMPRRARRVRREDCSSDYQKRWDWRRSLSRDRRSGGGAVSRPRPWPIISAFSFLDIDVAFFGH